MPGASYVVTPSTPTPPAAGGAFRVPAAPEDGPTPFRVYLPGIVPPWVGRAGRDLLTRLGLVLDTVWQATTDAVKARFPSWASVDALARIGDDRQIERAPGETRPTYRRRLLDAFATWRKAGSDLGIVDAFAAVGLTARVYRNAQWNVDGNGGNVAPYWARMWIVVDNPGPWRAPIVAGSGAVAGASAGLAGIVGTTVEEVARIRRLARKWSSSHVQIGSEILVIAGHLCGDGVTAGDGTTCGGTAAYLEGW